MVQRRSITVVEQVLFRDIGDVLAVRILGEQVVEGLVLARAHLGWDRLVPFLGVVELGIDVEDHAAEREQPVAHHLADPELRRLHASHHKPSLRYLAQGRLKFNPE